MSGPVYDVLREFAHDSFGSAKFEHGSGHGVKSIGGNGMVEGAMMIWEKVMHIWNADTKRLFLLMLFIIPTLLFAMTFCVIPYNSHYAVANLSSSSLYVVMIMTLLQGAYILVHTDVFGGGKNQATAIAFGLYCILLSSVILFSMVTTRLFTHSSEDELRERDIECDKRLQELTSTTTPCREAIAENHYSSQIFRGAIHIQYVIMVIIAMLPVFFYLARKFDLKFKGQTFANDPDKWGKSLLHRTFICALVVIGFDVILFVMGRSHSGAAGNLFFLLVKDILVVIMACLWLTHKWGGLNDPTANRTDIASSTVTAEAAVMVPWEKICEFVQQYEDKKA